MTKRWETDHPAARAVDSGAARTVVDLMELRGVELLDLLKTLDVIPTTRHKSVNMDKLREHLGRFEVVTLGTRALYPSAPEPLHATLLCTCKRFLSRRQCPHATFTETLNITHIRQSTITNMDSFILQPPSMTNTTS